MKLLYLSLIGVLVNIGLAQTMMNRYCAAPPFVGGKQAVVIPNVLIVQDMTGSMTFSAYKNFGEKYDSTRTYYGYAHPASKYTRIFKYPKLHSMHMDSIYFFKKDAAGKYPGNKINFAFMERIDVARKSLTGGKGVNYWNKETLYFQDIQYDSINGFGNHRSQYKGIITTDTTDRTKGFLRTIGDEDNNYKWDADAPHFALMTFSNAGPFYRQVKCPFGDSLRFFLDTLEKKTPDGGTNCGDAIFEAIHYLRYCAPHWSGDYAWDVSKVGTSTDPWYEVVSGETVSVSCRPTFCIVIGDGGSNMDTPTLSCSHLPWSASPYGSAHDAFWKYDFDYDWADSNGIDPYDDSNQGGMPYDHTRPGDDYAYYAHINDLRPDNDSIYGISGNQSITFYSIYLFAKGEDKDADSIFFSKIAKHGGFADLNNDGKPGPDPAEWDSRPPFGRPDNFFYADQGEQLDSALAEIFIDVAVIARVTSAAAATISSSGVHGEGIAYQAQFYPKLITGPDTLTWIGSVQALWLDRFGFLREDTDHNKRLHLKDDYVVDMYFDSLTARTRAQIYRDTAGIGNESLFVALGSEPVESLNFLWNAGEQLLNRDADDRWIYTKTLEQFDIAPDEFHPLNPDIDFHLGIVSAVPTREYCDSVINYIRGHDYPNRRDFRSRTLGTKVWKLGDIIYSSPVVVSKPMENYHQIYGDDSYYDFWNYYQNRSAVVYVGANDGMIHAFNGGVYNKLDNPFELAELQNGSSGTVPGTELWAFIPRNLLPHLKWLTDTSYCHVYYNDLKPYATDAKLWGSGDAEHISGWGTMLICGQRFGGGQINVIGPSPAPQYWSSYTAFDITTGYLRPPKVLWSFNASIFLGYTLCPPTMIRVGENDEARWFLLIGAGPTTRYGERPLVGMIFIIDPLDGTILRNWALPLRATSITNIFGVDVDLDYSVDLVYFGTYDNANQGRIYRIKTDNDPDPNNWTVHELIDLRKPVTSEGSVALDDYGQLWVYFGTGKYYSSVDIGNQDTMYFVGIKDDIKSMPTYTLSDLLDVSHVEVFEDSVTVYGTWDSLMAAVGNKAGWIRKLDSLPGERVLTAPTVLGGGVIFTSYTPRDTAGAVPEMDLCMTTGGTQGGNLWALYYMTGTAYKTPMVGEDVNGRRLTHTPIIGDIPSEPVMHIGLAKDKVFIQTSGGLIDYETPLPYDPRGGVMLWRGR